MGFNYEIAVSVDGSDRTGETNLMIYTRMPSGAALDRRNVGGRVEMDCFFCSSNKSIFFLELSYQMTGVVVFIW